MLTRALVDSGAPSPRAGLRRRRRRVDLLSLPADNPDLNRVEQMFLKFKAEIRKRKARAKAACDDLWVECLDWLPAAECRD